MKSILKLSLWIAAIVIFTSCDKKTESLPENVTQNIQNRIDYGLNGAIAIGIIDSSGIRYYNFGTRDSTSTPVDEHTIFEIGSVSKTFTATLLADQVLKANMNLDDHVNEFLPDSIKIPVLGNQQITLGHLSDHSSGLPRMPSNFSPTNPNNPYADYTVAQMYEFISSYSPIRKVGAEFEYSNLAVGLLGHVLSLQAGKNYEELLGEIITVPLGMSETKITLDEQMKNNLARGQNEFGQNAENWDIPTLAGAGAIRSSTADIIKYLSAQLGYSDSQLRQAFDLTYKKRHTMFDLFGEEPLAVGLGWIYAPGINNEILWHTGGTGGYKTFAGFDRKSGKGVVILSTGNRPTDIGLYLLNVTDSINSVKRLLSIDLIKEIDKNELSEAKKHFESEVLLNLNEYDYDEDRINTLGYRYLAKENIDAALMVFEINIRLFPDASNPYDSYGEALRKKGRLEESLKNYRKSVELDPENQHGLNMIVELEDELEIDPNENF